MSLGSDLDARLATLNAAITALTARVVKLETPPLAAYKMLLAAVSYMYPSATPEKIAAWAAFCKDAKVVILNAPSGVGSTPNADYVTQMARCRAVPGLKVLGYLTTNRYDRLGAQGDGVDRTSTVAIKAEIDRLISHYGRFDGFFLDEMDNLADAAVVAKHADIAAYIRSKGCMVVWNPGTAIPESYMPLGDIFMNSEGTAASYRTKTFAPWTLNYPGRFYHCVHGCTAADLPEMVTLAKARGAYWFYACNLYSEFPAFWLDMVARVGA